jgi:hypothetical protein
MTRKEYYTDWDGVCVRCGQNYFLNRGNSTCLSCNLQRQGEIRDGLIFDEDIEAGETLAGLRAELGLPFDGPSWDVVRFTRGRSRCTVLKSFPTEEAAKEFYSMHAAEYEPSGIYYLAIMHDDSLVD